MTQAFRPPYYGAAYYPEDWPLEQIDEDVALMTQSGMNVMRVGEFAWARMEPQEGQFEFGWLETAIAKLDAAGIATILCTPTCTPPAWLTTAHPEVLFVYPDGRRTTHGGRRHTCPNSPVYREYCARIVRAMAERFGDDSRILGWQIDNELSPHYAVTPRPIFQTSCYCPVCRERFAAFLEKRYGTIEALNNAWCLNLWSQKYDAFAQIPAPDPLNWHHPSLLQAWEEFGAQSYIDFSNAQAAILHEKATQPVGTDMMPVFVSDHYEMNRALDVAQLNHYNMYEGFRNAAFWFDYFRTLKDRPFWNTESCTAWPGMTAAFGCSDAGYCRAVSWFPMALGGEANLFWLWRPHWAGQELSFSGVVSSQGRPMHIFSEVQQTAAEFRKASDFLNGTRPVSSGLAIQQSYLSAVLLKHQPMVNGFQYPSELLQRVYHPIIRKQLRPDVIGPQTDLNPYKVIVGAFLPVLDENDLRTRLEKWTQDGGIWIAGPFTDCRTPDGAKFRHAPFGSLEDWAGVYCKYQIPGGKRTFRMRWENGVEETGALCYDAFEPRGAETLAEYIDGELAGLAAISRRRMGKGQVILLGTMPSAETYSTLVLRIAAEADIRPVAEASNNVIVVPRSGPGGEGVVLLELDNKPALCNLPRPGINLLDGKAVSGALELPPYGVAMVQYNG